MEMSYIKNDKYSHKSYFRYIKLVHICLKLIGLCRSSSNRSRNPVLISVFLVHFLAGLLGSVHRLMSLNQDLYVGTEIVMNISLLLHTICIYLVLVWKQPIIMKMLDVVECRFNHFSAKLFVEDNNLESAAKLNTVLVTMIASIIFSVHLSFIAVSKVYLIHLPPENKSFMFPVSTPFPLTNLTYYYIYLVEVVITVMEAAVHIPSITLCTGFINLLCAEFRSLGRAFRDADSLVRNRALHSAAPGWTKKDRMDYQANKLLKECVRHHMLLIEFYKDLQLTFGILVLEMFINSQIMLCSCGFNVFKERALVQLFKQLCMFAALISHEFIYFWSGSRLTEQVDRFTAEVHECTWFRFSPRYQRSYRLILERLKRPVIIHGVIVPANLATFAKAALSYFNILLALSYKHEKA